MLCPNFLSVILCLGHWLSLSPFVLFSSLCPCCVFFWFSVCQIYPCPFVFCFTAFSLSLSFITCYLCLCLLSSSFLCQSFPFSFFLPVLVARIARPASLTIWHRGRSHRGPNWRKNPNHRHFALLDLKRHSEVLHRRPTS